METITIRGKTVRLVTPEGKKLAMGLGELLEKALPRGADTGGVGPPGVRLMDSAGRLTVWVHEIPPGVRQLKWIAEDSRRPYGERTKYRMVRVALPYLVVFAVFENGVLSDVNECFFRVAPLGDEREDDLCFPALLNCSRFEPAAGRPLSWICSQKLDRDALFRENDPKKRMRRGLETLLRCLLETGFNYSSENHEFSSWFTESTKVDPRISSVAEWEKATAENPLFVLDVPWIKTGKTVAEVVERIFANGGARRQPVASASDLARVITNHTKS